ncbi:hypothetical protein F5884DRAFT_30680 [Xylogone sp. PMI_703]|nr:hypothetical protein F5884DRAFT_30680 [Xylogone sp. PMI_703]
MTRHATAVANLGLQAIWALLGLSDAGVGRLVDGSIASPLAWELCSCHLMRPRPSRLGRRPPPPIRRPPPHAHKPPPPECGLSIVQLQPRYVVLHGSPFKVDLQCRAMIARPWLQIHTTRTQRQTSLGPRIWLRRELEWRGELEEQQDGE